MINSEPKNLSWEVVQRLDALKQIQAHLEKEDKHEHLSTVKAIIDAYRSGQLSLDGTGMVTFWSYGKLIAGPKDLEFNELYALNAKHGPNGFWLERGM